MNQPVAMVMMPGTNHRRRVSLVAATLLVFCDILISGCGDPHSINVDLSADQPRFILHHLTWGWPFRWPRVSAIVIADSKDAVWEIHSTDPSGVPTRHLAIVYGELPNGFYQVSPKGHAPPMPLRAGRDYYIGATGPDSVFRAVFALSVNPKGVYRQTPVTPDVPSHPIKSPRKSKKSAGPADRPATPAP